MIMVRHQAISDEFNFIEGKKPIHKIDQVKIVFFIKNNRSTVNSPIEVMQVQRIQIYIPFLCDAFADLPLKRE